MKQGRLRRILILLAAAAICMIMARFSQAYFGRSAQTLALWYTREVFPPAAMDTLLAQARTQAGVRIEARCFEDEDALAAAFESARPDLLFCSRSRAVQLNGRGGLAALPEILTAPGLPVGEEPAIGLSFFPLGARVPLLLVNSALTGANFDSLETLLDTAQGRPFLVTDDPAGLLHAAVISSGGTMTGVPEEDGRQAGYQAAYNQLALAVLRGNLAAVADGAAEYVRQGLVPCAVACSTSLTGVSGRDLRFRPLPLPRDGSRQIAAELMGFALIDGGRAQTAADFLRWLWSDTAGGDAALAAGLAPLSPARDLSGTGGLTGALYDLSQSGRLCFPTDGEGFYLRRADCSRRLREAFDLL